MWRVYMKRKAKPLVSHLPKYYRFTPLKLLHATITSALHKTRTQYINNNLIILGLMDYIRNNKLCNGYITTNEELIELLNKIDENKIDELELSLLVELKQIIKNNKYNISTDVVYKEIKTKGTHKKTESVSI